MTKIALMEARMLFDKLRIPGWIFILLGFGCIAWPTVATIALEQLIAWLLVFSGISGILFWRSFSVGRVGMAGLVTAGLVLILGLVFAFQPIAGARTLTMILTLVFLVEGVLGIFVAMALRDQNAGWIWTLLSALSTLILAALIIIGWPGTSVWLVGLLFGLNLITTGAALLAMAYSGKV
jgi:uncharacterized membrane protein HdeD (DUF308 family)